ncbi:hypothetical protein PFDG_04308 [Plasmodium falciparum Dd2]|uniref:Uncharacterized protein n=1 Tax=Plasmodium falciparum (isolate Dd2) TaxID=57267 RepID=A0A0L7M4U2_PLAF4|nr:hypothetical protein PFDG_04308 [Plasmodium falciparum Dd2]
MDGLCTISISYQFKQSRTYKKFGKYFHQMLEQILYTQKSRYLQKLSTIFLSKSSLSEKIIFPLLCH